MITMRACLNSSTNNSRLKIFRGSFKTFCPRFWSLEMQQVGMGMTEKLVKGRLMMLDGSHLFPMEKPLATAAAIEAALLSLGA